MNEMLNKFLLAGDTLMPKMHFRQSEGITCKQFTKNQERIKKSKETGHCRYIYQKELDKVCFQHNIGYGDSRNFSRGASSDKILPDKLFNIY